MPRLTSFYIEDLWGSFVTRGPALLLLREIGMRNFLKTIDAPKTASWSEIKSAYRTQLKVWHPDKFLHDEKLRLKAEEQSKDINYAFRRLEECYGELQKRGQAPGPDEPFLQKYQNSVNDRSRVSGIYTPEDGRWGYGPESFRMFASDIIEATQSGIHGAWQTASLGASQVFRGVNNRAQQMWDDVREQRTIARRKRIMSRLAIGAGLTVSLLVIGFAAGYSSDAAPEKIVIPVVSDELVRHLSTPTPTASSDAKGSSPADLLSRSSFEEVVRKRVSPKPPLITAAANCNVNVLKRLLDSGASVNQTDGSGQSALSWAAKRNCTSAAEILLKYGANVNQPSANGFTPYRWAKWYKNHEMITLLSKSRAR